MGGSLAVLCAAARERSRLHVWFGAALAWFALAGPAAGSSVLQVHLSEMLSRCELIFEGRVVGHSVEDFGSGLRTWVEFEVLDVVKGPDPGRTLSLAFLGGELDGVVSEVAGLRLPDPGERGIYFVESLTRLQVHPLYGWDQGRLRIERDADGSERVVSALGRPVIGVSPETPLAREAAIGTGAGPADGIEIDREAPLRAALTPAEFKAALSRALDDARAEAK